MIRHCPAPRGPVAVVTGIVEDTDVPGLKDRRVGMTVYDNGKRDRLGYSWVRIPSPSRSCRRV
ncbi:hypothetical protein [Amycolatopsis japonica]